MTRGLAIALAGALLMAVLAGCGGSESADEATSREAVSSATVEATATSPADGTASAPATTGSGTASTGGADQANLQAELEAIERELDAMALPGDADFGDIESALQ